MSTSTLKERKALCTKLQDLFLSVRRSTSPHFATALLSEMGVDTSKFNLIEDTLQGVPYFRPMSQQRLSSLDKRPDMYKIPF